ncbi:hypothetical protein GQ600_11842 [Phytophthora cactorum]|nr:hypothetical protein GQ600_11842 [Phytophthora cactorum]
MRTAAVLCAALVAISQSAQGLRVLSSVCDRRGERPVQVVGVSGTFCVAQRPCEGFVTGDELLACPRAGQRDVFGGDELAGDSCCAVVDSNSGALGCVLVAEGSQTACLSREREFARVGRRRARSRTLQDVVTSEVIFTISVSPAVAAQETPTTEAPVATTGARSDNSSTGSYDNDSSPDCYY